MTMEVFKAACKIARDHDEGITIGGGEPTVHPRFWEIFGVALGHLVGGDMSLYVVTNGKNTKTALALANIAWGPIYVDLSQDDFHESIDERVVKEFTKKKGPSYHSVDHRQSNAGIRNVVKDGDYSRLARNGRGESCGGIGKCGCEDVFIDPTGGMWACGCQKISYGNVLSGGDIPGDHIHGECSTVIYGECQEEDDDLE